MRHYGSPPTDYSVDTWADFGSEELFKGWISLSLNSGDEAAALSTVKTACKRLPASLALWKEQLALLVRGPALAVLMFLFGVCFLWGNALRAEGYIETNLD